MQLYIKAYVHYRWHANYALQRKQCLVVFLVAVIGNTLLCGLLLLEAMERLMSHRAPACRT
jgi:hypothetical protein